MDNGVLRRLLSISPLLDSYRHLGPCVSPEFAMVRFFIVVVYHLNVSTCLDWITVLLMHAHNISIYALARTGRIWWQSRGDLGFGIWLDLQLFQARHPLL